VEKPENLIEYAELFPGLEIKAKQYVKVIYMPISLKMRKIGFFV